MSLDWVSVKDRLPADEGKYLCVVKKHGIRLREFRDWANSSRLRWWSNGVETLNVTHWMELPEQPHE